MNKKVRMRTVRLPSYRVYGIKHPLRMADPDVFKDFERAGAPIALVDSVKKMRTPIVRPMCSKLPNMNRKRSVVITGEVSFENMVIDAVLGLATLLTQLSKEPIQNDPKLGRLSHPGFLTRAAAHVAITHYIVRHRSQLPYKRPRNDCFN